MKRSALLAFSMCLLVGSANAQFYFRAGVGYAMPQAAQTLDGNGTPYNGSSTNSTYQTTYSVKSASLSSGVPATVGFGYMFGDHVGVQLDGCFGLSNTKYTFSNTNVSFAGYTGNESTTIQAKSPIFLIPSVVLQSGGHSAWNLYARTGLVLPLKSDVTVDDAYYIPSQSVTDAFTSKLKNTFSLGLSAAAGVQYKLSDHMTVWGEVSMLSMSLFLKESEYTNISENGQSFPLSTIGGAHPVKYSKNAIVDTSYSNLPTYAQPFSNVGISVGITIRLSDKKHADRDLIDDTKSKPYKRKNR